MRRRPAGDVDYERTGGQYSETRRPDPMVAALVRAALGDARSLVNVGAGAGSYEPIELDVVAVEPSASMRAQRPSELGPAVDAAAEALPFAAHAFDAALASVTIHQWRDLARGLSEMRRVTSGPVVILTFDPDALRRFWLAEYAGEMIEYECSRMPPVDLVTEHLGGRSTVQQVPIPAHCADGFGEAFFGRPEAFLDDDVRRSQSGWGFIESEVETRSVAALRASLEDGSWDRRHGRLRTLDRYEGSLRLITAYRS